jgi:short-subunit dehydrogenase
VLHKELELAGAKVRVSVLCPGFVRTNILDAERNRPTDLAETASVRTGPMVEMMRAELAAGMPPEQVAEEVLAAIRADRFYILTHPELTPLVALRMDEIVGGRNPSVTMAATSDPGPAERAR